MCWARALVLSLSPTALLHSGHPHSSSPSSKPAYQFSFFEPDPFAGTCVGPDLVGMGGSGRLLHGSSSSDVLRPDLLPGSAHFWTKPGPTLGWPAVQGIGHPCSGGFRAVTGGLTQHWWLSHRDRGGPCLLLPGGRLSQPAWRQEAAADPQLPVSADSLPHPPPQMALHPMGGTLPAAAHRGPLLTGNCYWMPQRRTPITCPSPRSSQDPCSGEDDLTQSRVPHPTPGLRRSCLSWRPGPGPGPLP